MRRESPASRAPSRSASLRLNSTASRLIRPLSTLARSRMPLISASSAWPLLITVLKISSLLVVERGFHQLIGHPEDRVHRRANFVRHARQEFRLGARRRQRRLARRDQFALGHLEVGDFARNRQAAELSVELQVHRRKRAPAAPSRPSWRNATSRFRTSLVRES